MSRRANVAVASVFGGSSTYNAAATNYLIQTPDGTLYLVYIDSLADILFKKSTDGGITWSTSTVILAGTATALAVWYDKWSGLAGGLIHCAYTETVSDDTFYRTIDTASSDALSTQTSVHDGTSAVGAGSFLSITRARGGNVYVRTQIDAGVEGGFYRLLNANVPNGAWASRTINEANATQDQIILAPGFGADNQDILAIFWDASADRVSRQIHDDSANSWAETEFGAPMTFVDGLATAGWAHFAVAVDLTNSQLLVVAWNAIDTANADLTCWTVTESAITAKTDVVTNSTDDQGLCAIELDLVTGWWTVYYGGKSDGSETYSSILTLHCKVSKDGGSTWGAESALVSAPHNMPNLFCCPRRYLGSQMAVFYRGAGADEYVLNVDRTVPRAQNLIGV